MELVVVKLCVAKDKLVVIILEPVVNVVVVELGFAWIVVETISSVEVELRVVIMEIVSVEVSLELLDFKVLVVLEETQDALKRYKI